MWNNQKQQIKLFSLMPNLQTYCHFFFQLDFQKVDQHTGGKWLIHGTKGWKDNPLQSLEHPCRIELLSKNECCNFPDYMYMLHDHFSSKT